MASSWDPEAWSEKVQIHAFLMIAAWGFFLPVGLVTQSHLRTASSGWKQRKFGNHCHMSSMTIGVLMALAGFWYGVRNLTTFTRNPQYVTDYAMVHAVLGTVVTFLMIVGVLLVGMVRTVQPGDDRYEDWPTWRKIGHASHRGIGFITLLLAFFTLETGTHISSMHGRGFDDEYLGNKDREYSMWLMGTYLTCIVVTFGSIQLAKQKYPGDSVISESEAISKDLSELSPLLPL